METMGLVVHDDQTFLAKVVNTGMERGILTQDRVSEIIRISTAMANKYVLQKEVDFRSTEELAKVQETILKLVGVGLEIKAKGDTREGLRLLMHASPVDLFRLAHTRIEKLRQGWNRLLLNHRVEIMVSSEEYDCLSDLTCQRLSEMSVFTDSEIYTIRSLTLGDELFSSLALVEYYEAELQRYEFILSLRALLPFGLLNRSPLVRAENLSEVDSIRDALINTLVVSACVNAADPVSVTVSDVREFLSRLDLTGGEDLFPEEVEEAVLDVIQELAEDIEEAEASLLAREVIQCSQKLFQTILNEWDTANSASYTTFFKRWSRLVILSDVTDPVNRILSSDEMLDEFEFEVLVEQLLARSEEDATLLIGKLPWKRFSPHQIVRLFHEVRMYQEAFAEDASLTGFSGADLVDLLDGLDQPALKKMLPVLREAFADADLSLEELELIAALPHSEAVSLLQMANRPAGMEDRQILAEYKDGSSGVRRVLLFSCLRSEVFPDLFSEAWSLDPDFVKQELKSVPPVDIGPFLSVAAGPDRPTITDTERKEPSLRFRSRDLNSLFRSLPVSKKRAAVKFFSKVFPSSEQDSA